MTVQPGTLFIVATPIGNLEDFSQRARETLSSVQCIYAEDTRHSARLLDRYSISTRPRSLHEHNESARIAEIAERLRQGDDIAIISDAGTPLVSDPGFRLVEHCHDAGLPVAPVPGPSAVLAALSVSGQPADSFVYAGFVPQKQAARERWLTNLADEQRTLILFESPHRVVATLESMLSSFGPQRSVTIARELTKLHETVIKAALLDHVENARAGKLTIKGEFVLVVAGNSSTPADPGAEEEQIKTMLVVLMRRMSVKDAASCVAEITGTRKNRVYSIAMTLSSNRPGDD